MTCPLPTTKTVELDYTPPPTPPHPAFATACFVVFVYVRCGQLPTPQHRYPPSLLRIISSRRLLQEGGLLHFFDTDAAWQYK